MKKSGEKMKIGAATTSGETMSGEAAETIPTPVRTTSNLTS